MPAFRNCGYLKLRENGRDKRQKSDSSISVQNYFHKYNYTISFRLSTRADEIAFDVSDCHNNCDVNFMKKQLIKQAISRGGNQWRN